MWKCCSVPGTRAEMYVNTRSTQPNIATARTAASTSVRTAHSSGGTWALAERIRAGSACMGKMVSVFKIDRIDHVVLTVFDLDRTIDFYSRVLGMEPVAFAGGRRGLAF